MHGGQSCASCGWLLQIIYPKGMHMKIKKSALAVLVLGMFAATSAMAVGEGREITVSGSMDNTSSNGTSTSSTYVNAAYGVTIQPQLVGRVSVSLISSDSGGSTTGVTVLGGGVKYYFGPGVKSAWVPFALADLTYVTADSSGTSATGYGYDVGVGASNFITESVSFDISAKLTSSTLDASGTTYTSDGSRVEFGFTARF